MKMRRIKKFRKIKTRRRLMGVNLKSVEIAEPRPDHKFQRRVARETGNPPAGLRDQP